MFNNRPAMKKDMPIQMAENQKKFADLEKDFFTIRDAVQRELLSNNNNDIMMNVADLKKLIEKSFDQVVAQENMLLNVSTRDQLLQWVLDDILGYGPLEPLLSNPDITEIMVNGYDEVFVERYGLI